MSCHGVIDKPLALCRGVQVSIRCFSSLWDETSKAELLLWLFMFFLSSARLFICALCSPAGKELTSCSRLWCLTMRLLLSFWYPGPGMVLDCIDS